MADLQTRATDTAAFLTRSPERSRDGFDLLTGRATDSYLALQFGEWEDVTDVEDDGTLARLKYVHGRSRTLFADFVDTVSSVRNDDDPSLNAEGRLKIAARILKPHLEEAERLLAQEQANARQQVEAERGEIEKKARAADAVDLAALGEVRAWLRGLPDNRRHEEIMRALAGRDLVILRAVATMPPQLSGLNNIETGYYSRVRDLLAETVAPANVRRLKAVQAAMLKAEQGVRAYTSRVRSLVDFDKAASLSEREAARLRKERGE